MGPSGIQILVIVLIVILLFGGKKIPELAKGLGSGIKNFKKALKEDDEDLEISKDDSKAKEIKNDEIKQA